MLNQSKCKRETYNNFNCIKMQIDGIELTTLKVEKGEISKGKVCVKKNK